MFYRTRLIDKVSFEPDPGAHPHRGWGSNSLPSNGTVRSILGPLAKPDLYPAA